MQSNAAPEQGRALLRAPLRDKKLTQVTNSRSPEKLPGEKTMAYQGEPGEEIVGRGAFHALGKTGEGRPADQDASGPERASRSKRNGPPHLEGKPSEKMPPVRKDKVEKAKKRKSNGDYDNQEVYRKIAERLIDSFGI
jgi:hypothetical protein